jgi:CDP-paratose 2-epimerase
VKVLITGICGFVGSTLAIGLRDHVELLGADNFIRPGSESNRLRLRSLGIQVFHSDIRSISDVGSWPKVDWILDAAALPSVLSGVDGRSSSRQVMEHNLAGTINLLEYCREHRAGFILLSTSRVYSIPPLAALPLRTEKDSFVIDTEQALPLGVSEKGVNESFSTSPPVSLYGATKVASEHLALEYGSAFGFPTWINRCGVLAGGGQFGQAEQGIFSFWIHSWRQKQPLRYIGFEGSGAQVRDALHPRDLVPLILNQIAAGASLKPRVVNVAGGVPNSISLAQLSTWCATRFGPRNISRDLSPRPFDIPWLALDSSLAQVTWGWQPMTSLPDILEEIAIHAESSPNWLDLSRP